MNKSNFWTQSGSDHHIPDPVVVPRGKTNVQNHQLESPNKALINRDSLTFWLDESAIQAWCDEPKTPSRGRPQRYSELAISNVLMLKRVFRLTLCSAQAFIYSIFTLMNLPLRCQEYSCVSRRAKSVSIPFKNPASCEIARLVIDSTGLKVVGEGEWKVKKNGQEKRSVWRKPHLVDADTHEIIYTDQSLNNVTDDAEAFQGAYTSDAPENQSRLCRRGF